MKIIVVALLSFLSLAITPVLADIGVGVGTGKIQVDEDLKPGIIYELPSLSVVNTGTVESDYEVEISYHEKQPQLRPDGDWFIFSPKTFHLKPGETQLVSIKLSLPLKTEPGDYFGYIEAHPFNKAQSGNTTIGVAAAAKLYFTIVPANFLTAIYYKITSFWKVYAPWPQRTAMLVGIILLIALTKKYFNIQVNLKKPDNNE